MPAISRIWARSALISAGLQPQQENWNPATGQRNWLTHPAVPPGTDDQNSTPARELEPPQPLLRSLDGGQHPCAKIGANAATLRPGPRSGELGLLRLRPGQALLSVDPSAVLGVGPGEAAPQPSGTVDQAEQHRHLDQRHRYGADPGVLTPVDDELQFSCD